MRFSPGLSITILTHPMLYRIAAAVVVTVCLAGSALAAEASVVSHLEALGAKLVKKDGEVTEFTLTNCKQLGPAEFKLIGQLTSLKKLTLFGGCHALNDETLPLLAGLKRLEAIGTDGARLTDDGFRHFAAFGNLRQASFFHTSFGMAGFTGVGFGHLKDCPRLERLTVAGISMGDEGLAAIGTLAQLKEFSTWHTWQTEAGNWHIARLSQLTSLKLGQRLPGKGREAPSLSDASMAALLTMKSLQTLKIGEARFTLDALKQLQGLPGLKSLVLYETDFPETQIPALSAALPGVKVTLEPLTEAQRKKLDMYVKP